LVRWRRTKEEAIASGLPVGIGVAFYQVPDEAKVQSLMPGTRL